MCKNKGFFMICRETDDLLEKEDKFDHLNIYRYICKRVNIKNVINEKHGKVDKDSFITSKVNLSKKFNISLMKVRRILVDLEKKYLAINSISETHNGKNRTKISLITCNMCSKNVNKNKCLVDRSGVTELLTEVPTELLTEVCESENTSDIESTGFEKSKVTELLTEVPTEVVNVNKEYILNKQHILNKQDIGTKNFKTPIFNIIKQKLPLVDGIIQIDSKYVEMIAKEYGLRDVFEEIVKCQEYLVLKKKKRNIDDCRRFFANWLRKSSASKANNTKNFTLYNNKPLFFSKNLSFVDRKINYELSDIQKIMSTWKDYNIHEVLKDIDKELISVWSNGNIKNFNQYLLATLKNKLLQPKFKLKNFEKNDANQLFKRRNSCEVLKDGSVILNIDKYM